jgi:hypothetical protein
VQTNPWVPGEIVFCWETGGKAPQRTWFVKSDGTGLRPLYPEAPYEWITHEAVIGKDEAVIAIIGHRRIEQATPDSDWGTAGTMEHPTGVAVVNLRTREMRIVGQVPAWSKGRSDWHVAGSADGRWAASDDFSYALWLYDRHSGRDQPAGRPAEDRRRSYSPHVQCGRHENRNPIRSDLEGQPVAEHLRGAGAEGLAEPDLQPEGARMNRKMTRAALPLLAVVLASRMAPAEQDRFAAVA